MGAVSGSGGAGVDPSIGALSERTLSPSMDSTNRTLEWSALNSRFSSVPREPNGPVKRKWSPDHSDLSTRTLSSHHDHVRGTESVSPVNTPYREAKRPTLCDREYQSRLALHPDRVLPEDRSHLLEVVWQHIFTYLPPDSLGRLICVNKTFYNLLVPRGGSPTLESPNQGRLRPLKPEQLWSISRRAFFPGMPRPLSSQSEFEMWKLLRGNRCTFCLKKNTRIAPKSSMTPWTAGPGIDYIRVIWPFAVRSCGKCLQSYVQKETDLLFSPCSGLLPALPFAFLTPSWNYIASVTLRKEPPPTGLQLAKWYYVPEVEKMKAKLDEVRSLGAAAAEEWFKGLEMDGKERAAETARWENWELSGGFSAVIRGTLLARACESPGREPSRSPFGIREKWSPVGYGLASVNALSVSRPGLDPRTSLQTNQVPPPSLPLKPTNTMSPCHLAYYGTVPNSSSAATKSYLDSEKTMHSVNEKKWERRREIERRCAELHPPIKPSTLALMESFVAAVQIAMPLTDHAWKLLKPRLLMQHEAAEQQEREQLTSNVPLASQPKERQPHDIPSMPPNDGMSRQWEESQTSIREKVHSYASDFIREKWQSGGALTQASCAQFAADVLLHVRHRFYSALVQEDARMRSIGLPVPTDLPNGGALRKLTLEHMRWVYEHTIRPLTERFQKELFLCNACDNQGKYYSLDSVIQHFAAKHTDSLSLGTAVVYWKAEWPELPPFDPNPTAAKASMYMSSISAPAPPSRQLLYNASTVSAGPIPSNIHVQDNFLCPAAVKDTAPYSKYSIQNRALSPGTRDPPPSFNASDRRIDGTTCAQHHFSSLDQGLCPVRPQQPICRDVVNTCRRCSTVHQSGFNAELGPSLACPPHDVMLSSVSTDRNNLYPSQPTSFSQPLLHSVLPSQQVGIYQTQIQDLAKDAREMWDGTSGIAAMMDSVRVQLIIGHIDFRFKDRYTNSPNLALFIDGLNSSPLMSPMRSLSGLVCKACVAATPNHAEHVQQNSILQYRMHTLPAILAHFRSVHVEHAQPKSISPTGLAPAMPDWKFDMVELPDAAVVRNLAYSAGMTRLKLNLIVRVLPTHFPPPIQENQPLRYGVEYGPDLIKAESTRAPQSHEPFHVTQRETQTPLKIADSTRSHERYPFMPEAKVSPETEYTGGGTVSRHLRLADAAPDDEYDPLRPACVNVGKLEEPSGGRRRSYVGIHQIEEGSHTSRPSTEGYGGQNEPDFMSTRPMSSIVKDGASSAHRPFSEGFHNRSYQSPYQNMAIFDPRGSLPQTKHFPPHTSGRNTPPPESQDAAEQFLESLDIPPDAAQTCQQTTPAAKAFSQEIHGPQGGRHHVFEPCADIRNYDTLWHSAQPWEETEEFSTAYVLPLEERYRSTGDAVAQTDSDREQAGPYCDRGSSLQSWIQGSAGMSPEKSAPSRTRTGRLLLHDRSRRESPSRRPSSRFERYEAQRQESWRPQSGSSVLGTKQLGSGKEYYRDVYSSKCPLPQNVPTTEQQYRHAAHAYADEVVVSQASEARSWLRSVDRPSYFERDLDDPIQDMRTAPSNAQLHQARDFQGHIAQDMSDPYVGYDQIAERDGRVYVRAPPSSRDVQQPYP